MSVDEHVQALLDGDRRARDAAAFARRRLPFEPRGIGAAGIGKPAAIVR